MSRKEPLISVAMPVYNGEEFITLAIKSVLEQTFEDFELLISDNASTDGTEEICREFEKKDKRITYYRNAENIGAGRNYNVIFKKARAKYFRWHNADDLADPRLQELCYKTLEENPEAVLAYGKTQIIDENGKHMRDYDDNLDLRDDDVYKRYCQFFKSVGWTNIIYGLVRREQLGKTALFGNFQAADTNLLAELVLYGKFIEIPEPLFLRRMHSSASSWDKKDKDVQKDFWDPSKKRLKYQTVKKHAAYISGVWNAPLDFSKKIKILGFLSRRVWWGREKLIKDIYYSLET